jgi:hypothetical protein
MKHNKSLALPGLEMAASWASWNDEANKVAEDKKV